MSDVPEPLIQALRFLLPFQVLATAAFLITNLLVRGWPYVTRVFAAVITSTALALPPLALQLKAETTVQRPQATLLMFAVTLPLLWLFLFRPGALNANTDPQPADRYLS